MGCYSSQPLMTPCVNVSINLLISSSSTDAKVTSVGGCDLKCCLIDNQDNIVGGIALPDIDNSLCHSAAAVVVTNQKNKSNSVIKLFQTPNAFCQYYSDRVIFAIMVVSSNQYPFTNAQRYAITEDMMRAASYLQSKLGITVIMEFFRPDIGDVPPVTDPTSDDEKFESTWRNPALNKLGYPYTSVSVNPLPGDTYAHRLSVAIGLQGTTDLLTSLRDKYKIKTSSNPDVYDIPWAVAGFYSNYNKRVGNSAAYAGFNIPTRFTVYYREMKDVPAAYPFGSDKTIIHESMHLFGGEDEYDNSRCELLCGMYSTPNYNAAVSAATPRIYSPRVPCMMDQISSSQDKLCYFTRCALGLPWFPAPNMTSIVNLIGHQCSNAMDSVVYQGKLHFFYVSTATGGDRKLMHCWTITGAPGQWYYGDANPTAGVEVMNTGSVVGLSEAGLGAVVHDNMINVFFFSGDIQDKTVYYIQIGPTGAISTLKSLAVGGGRPAFKAKIGAVSFDGQCCVFYSSFGTLGGLQYSFGLTAAAPTPITAFTVGGDGSFSLIKFQKRVVIVFLNASSFVDCLFYSSTGILDPSHSGANAWTLKKEPGSGNPAVQPADPNNPNGPYIQTQADNKCFSMVSSEIGADVPNGSDPNGSLYLFFRPNESAGTEKNLRLISTASLNSNYWIPPRWCSTVKDNPAGAILANGMTTCLYGNFIYIIYRNPVNTTGIFCQVVKGVVG